MNVFCFSQPVSSRQLALFNASSVCSMQSGRSSLVSKRVRERIPPPFLPSPISSSFQELASLFSSLSSFSSSSQHVEYSTRNKYRNPPSLTPPHTHRNPTPLRVITNQVTGSPPLPFPLPSMIVYVVLLRTLYYSVILFHNLFYSVLSSSLVIIFHLLEHPVQYLMNHPVYESEVNILVDLLIVEKVYRSIDPISPFPLIPSLPTSVHSYACI